MAHLLEKSILYILGLQDIGGGDAPSYYKIGVTSDSVAKRISSLQTGNPYTIIPIFSIEVDGAQIIERNLHGIFAPNRRILEWFNLSENELEQVKQKASELKEEISELIATVRELDQTYSSDILIEASPHALTLHKRVIELESEITKNALIMGILRAEMQSLTGKSKGITGISRVLITNPKPSFKRSELRKFNPEIYAEYTTLPKFKNRLKIIGKPTPTSFPVLYAAKNEAVNALPVIETDEVTENRQQRIPEMVSLHDQYIEFVSNDAELSMDLISTQLKIKVACGEARGIKGICEYIREDRMTFDEARFELEQPDLYEEFTIQSEPQRRFQLMKTKGY